MNEWMNGNKRHTKEVNVSWVICNKNCIVICISTRWCVLCRKGHHLTKRRTRARSHQRPNDWLSALWSAKPHYGCIQPIHILQLIWPAWKFPLSSTLWCDSLFLFLTRSLQPRRARISMAITSNNKQHTQSNAGSHLNAQSILQFYFVFFTLHRQSAVVDAIGFDSIESVYIWFGSM